MKLDTKPGLEMHTASAHYRRETEVWRRGRKISMQLPSIPSSSKIWPETDVFQSTDERRCTAHRSRAINENEKKRRTTWKTNAGAVQIRPSQTNTHSERQWPLQPELISAGITSISHSHQRAFRYAVFQIHAWMNDEFKIFL